MNSLQRFVWSKSHKKGVWIGTSSGVSNNYRIYNKYATFFTSENFYLSGDIQNITDNRLINFVKVEIGQPIFTESGYDASFGQGDDVWIYIESGNEKFKFFIGEKKGEFILKLPQPTKIDKIYSVTGEHGSLLYPFDENSIPSLSVTYFEDALVSYELI